MARLAPLANPTLAAAVEALRGRIAHAHVLARAGSEADTVAAGLLLLAEATALDYAPLRAEAEVELGEALWEIDPAASERHLHEGYSNAGALAEPRLTRADARQGSTAARSRPSIAVEPVRRALWHADGVPGERARARRSQGDARRRASEHQRSQVDALTEPSRRAPARVRTPAEQSRRALARIRTTESRVDGRRRASERRRSQVDARWRPSEH